jgi:hypothetical protein
MSYYVIYFLCLNGWRQFETHPFQKAFRMPTVSRDAGSRMKDGAKQRKTGNKEPFASFFCKKSRMSKVLFVDNTAIWHKK